MNFSVLELVSYRVFRFKPENPPPGRVQVGFLVRPYNPTRNPTQPKPDPKPVGLNPTRCAA